MSNGNLFAYFSLLLSFFTIQPRLSASDNEPPPQKLPAIIRSGFKFSPKTEIPAYYKHPGFQTLWETKLKFDSADTDLKDNIPFWKFSLSHLHSDSNDLEKSLRYIEMAENLSHISLKTSHIEQFYLAHVAFKTSYDYVMLNNFDGPMKDLTIMGIIEAGVKSIRHARAVGFQQLKFLGVAKKFPHTHGRTAQTRVKILNMAKNSVEDLAHLISFERHNLTTIYDEILDKLLNLEYKNFINQFIFTYSERYDSCNPLLLAARLKSAFNSDLDYFEAQIKREFALIKYVLQASGDDT